MCERGVLSEYPAARARASYWFDKHNHTARAARALAGSYTSSEHESRAARKGLYWFRNVKSRNVERSRAAQPGKLFLAKKFVYGW